ncbi:MAG: hypothetical protein AAF587_19930 [Bacteroidota bacterium]
MCHYITAILPAHADLQAINAIGKSYGVSFSTLGNEHIERQLQSDQQYLWKESKFCDCGTSFGAFACYQHTHPDTSLKDIKKLRKKGWSEAKIQKWLDNKARSKQKNERSEEWSKKTYEQDARVWIQFLTDLASENICGYLGLLFHWYRGGIESERIDIVQTHETGIDQLNEDAIFHFLEDHIYQINFRNKR